MSIADLHTPSASTAAAANLQSTASETSSGDDERRNNDVQAQVRRLTALKEDIETRIDVFASTLQLVSPLLEGYTPFA